MKSILVILSGILFISASDRVYSQKYLTKGQVKDYNVGDIIQSCYNTYSPFGTDPPPTYYTQTVLTKSYSANKDTIYYSSQMRSFNPGRMNNPTYYVDTFFETVTNLNEPIIHGNKTNCYPIIDTMYIDYGNRWVWEKYPDYDDDTNCFEAVTNRTKYIEGIGGPYYNICYPMGSYISYEEELIYFKKGSLSWGTWYNSVIDMETISEKYVVFPNPANDHIFIKTAETCTRYEIVDITGKIVLADNLVNKHVDVSELQTGIYFINLYKNVNKSVKFKIVKK